MKLVKISKLSLILLSVMSIQSAIACTDVNVQATNGDVVAGRTMEWAFPMQWNILYYPKGAKIQLYGPSGSNMPTTDVVSKYDVIGVGSGVANNTLLEGQNSGGLGLSGNFLPGYTKYSTVDKKDKYYISILQFGRYILSNYKTVDEVKQNITKYKVFGETVPNLPVEPTVHYLVTDRSGNSIVIEFINGQMKVYDKTLGVMTNAPTYDWHLINTRNYVSLSNDRDTVVKTEMFGDVTGYSQGNASFGLPGDYTSSSRFVKVAFLNHYATKAKNATDAVNLTDHILNTVDIPFGVVASKQNGKVTTDYTQWIAIKDLQNNQLYFADYANRSNLVIIDMNKLASNKEVVLPINKIVYPRNDITNQLVK